MPQFGTAPDGIGSEDVSYPRKVYDAWLVRLSGHRSKLPAYGCVVEYALSLFDDNEVPYRRCDEQVERQRYTTSLGASFVVGLPGCQRLPPEVLLGEFEPAG